MAAIVPAYRATWIPMYQGLSRAPSVPARSEKSAPISSAKVGWQYWVDGRGVQSIAPAIPASRCRVYAARMKAGGTTPPAEGGRRKSAACEDYAPDRRPGTFGPKCIRRPAGWQIAADRDRLARGTAREEEAATSLRPAPGALAADAAGERAPAGRRVGAFQRSRPSRPASRPPSRWRAEPSRAKPEPKPAEEPEPLCEAVAEEAEPPGPSSLRWPTLARLPTKDDKSRGVAARPARIREVSRLAIAWTRGWSGDAFAEKPK
jgi:hypothetical protein